jgi:hypothetical protein
MTQPRPSAAAPFVRVELHDSALLVGARWWQEQLRLAPDPVARRSAMLGLSALVALTAMGGGCVLCVAASSSSSSSSSPDDIATDDKDSLDTQKQYGWSFGNENEPLELGIDQVNEAYGEPGLFDRATLDRMATDLTPKNPALRPYYVPTLFQSLTATPASGYVSDQPPARLRDVLRPIRTSAMEEAFDRGRALATLLDGAPEGRAIFVDLPGPQAVAFAAGLAERADPVFTFDNWPHPKGVVPAQATLAAAAYYAPYLVKRAAARPAKAPPVFVFDSSRLAPYTDASDKFDNRYVARAPTADKLKELGVKQVLYVRPNSVFAELDDINADLTAYKDAGIDTRLVALDEFKPDPAAPPANAAAATKQDAGSDAATAPPRRTTYYYGGSPGYNWWFWPHYGWGRPARTMSSSPPPGVSASSYRPTLRTTSFAGVGTTKSRPSGFGREPVAVSRSSGRVVGSSRSGSWTRSSGWTGS